MLVYHVLVLAKEPRVFKMIPECPPRYGAHVLLSDVGLNWVVRDYLLLFLMGRELTVKDMHLVFVMQNTLQKPL